MSYSRWLTSPWYMFWAITDSDKKDEQYCEIFYSINETTKVYFGELKEDFEQTVKDLEDIFYRANIEEIKELSVYLNKFYDDVLADEKTV